MSYFSLFEEIIPIDSICQIYTEETSWLNKEFDLRIHYKGYKEYRDQYRTNSREKLNEQLERIVERTKNGPLSRVEFDCLVNMDEIVALTHYDVTLRAVKQHTFNSSIDEKAFSELREKILNHLFMTENISLLVWNTLKELTKTTIIVALPLLSSTINILNGNIVGRMPLMTVIEHSEKLKIA